MESDERYYWRRAQEELAAAARAVTPAAAQPRRELATSFLLKLSVAGAVALEAQDLFQA